MERKTAELQRNAAELQLKIDDEARVRRWMKLCEPSRAFPEGARLLSQSELSDRVTSRIAERERERGRQRRKRRRGRKHSTDTDSTLPLLGDSRRRQRLHDPSSSSSDVL